jgi:pSer/pThr/pTyr-binding forkhead associated (FHA) protein
MGDPKKPSLTVLGGPMAGTRFVFEDASEEITVGSDEGCSFRLELPGVAPNHARIVIEGGAMLIHDTDAGSERGLHVNDNRVGESGTALRNGDIVWLGTPGDAEVVMLQCILPRLTPAASTAAASTAAAPSSSPFSSPAATPFPPQLAHEDETATVNLEADTLFGADTVIQATPSAAEPPAMAAQEFVVAEEPGTQPSWSRSP